MARWILAGGGATAKMLLALALLGGALAAVSYAAAGPVWSGGPGQEPSAASDPAPAGEGEARPPRPAITRHPRAIATSPTASFSLRVARGISRFRCRLDDGDWRSCLTPVVYRGVGLGPHRFSVRAIGPEGRRSRSARFRWRRVEAKPLAIEASLSGLGSLYPGAPATALPVVLSNPNPVRILVTAVTVAATADPPGCDSATNLALAPAGVSSAAPLVLPPGGSARLPSAGVAAPSIALRDLPVNQDACQGASFPLHFSARAHG